MCSVSFLLSANTAEWPRLGVTQTSIALFSPVARKAYYNDVMNQVISHFRHLCLSFFVEAASSFRSVPFPFPLLHSLQGQLFAHLALKSAMLPPLSLKNTPQFSVQYMQKDPKTALGCEKRTPISCTVLNEHNQIIHELYNMTHCLLT